MTNTVQEPLRDRVGRALYEEPGSNCNWYDLSEERREPWRKDADRIIPIVHRDYAAVVAERNRAQQACEEIARRLPDELDGQRRAQLEGLAIGLEQRGDKSAAHLIRIALLGHPSTVPSHQEKTP
jgi:hypothetical protein